MLIASIQDPNPVIFLEHRWLHNSYGPVSENYEVKKLGESKLIYKGSDLTIVSNSYMTLECIKAVKFLTEYGVTCDLIDLITISPLDSKTIFDSVKKTGQLIVVDGACKFGGIAGEIISLTVEECFTYLKSSPIRITYPDSPVPSTPALANLYYPTHKEIILTLAGKLNLDIDTAKIKVPKLLDIPDKSFQGPF